MKILVCVRRGRNGEISPFEASAYEAALRQKDAEVILLSMGPDSTAEYLRSLTRLGAKKAILLSDKYFAGSDTLVTAYVLSLAINMIKPDFIFCGRQTLEGDTGQTGPMLSSLCGYNAVTESMGVEVTGNEAVCQTRFEGEVRVFSPALITFERFAELRLPGLFSKVGELEVWNAEKIGADVSLCGLKGSPTRVLESFENQSGKRKCVFKEPSELKEVINDVISSQQEKVQKETASGEKMSKVWIVGEKPLGFARLVSDDITVIELDEPDKMAERISSEKPNAVLWATDSKSKRTASIVAAKLKLGLCADCTHLETDGQDLFMYRPALSGSVIAKIKSLTLPVMATVRTEENTKEQIVVAAGYGAYKDLEAIKGFADSIGAGIASSRRIVDNGLMTYDTQVGLTGKIISPKLYIAVGISGAVQHLVGMQNSGVIIAINPDKKAPIFEYADYGFVMEADQLKNMF